MEDMGMPCRRPAVNAPDPTQKAAVGDQYAVRQHPFMYFTSVIGAPDCAQHVVDLSQLPTDLTRASTTPNLTYITPNLCHDGHDSPCVDGQPGGLTSVDAWMKVWVPKILDSPAFKADGVLVITADESDGPHTDASACCGEGPGPNSPLPGIAGLGGGRVGALVLSRYVAPNTRSTTSYNHYSLLASIEDIFRLPYLGYAQSAGLNRFALDIYNSGLEPSLTGRAAHPAAGLSGAVHRGRPGMCLQGSLARSAELPDAVPMGHLNEQEALDHVSQRLATRFPEFSQASVRAMVGEAQARLAGPVRDYVPVLVEHQVRDALSRARASSDMGAAIRY